MLEIRRQRSACGIQASDIEHAERIIQVAGELREGQKQSGMVLLQQEEEEFRVDKGIHEGTTERKNTG